MRRVILIAVILMATVGADPLSHTVRFRLRETEAFLLDRRLKPQTRIAFAHRTLTVVSKFPPLADDIGDSGV
jgi:hypothetical protein